MSSHMLSQTLSAPLMSAQLMASGGRGGGGGGPGVPSMATNGSPMPHMPMMSGSGATILSQTLQQTTSSPLLLPTGGSPLQTSLRQPPQPPITFPSMVRPMATVNHSHGFNGNSDSLLSDQLMRESSEDSSSQSQQQLITNNGSIGGAGVTAAANAGLKNSVLILDKNRLHDLVQEVDPSEQLEEDVEDTLLTIADEFIESLVYTSALFAKHRKSQTLDVKDVQLALEKNWKMWIPGFGVDDHQQRQHQKRQAFVTEAHKQRMALIKKTMKKL